MLGRVSSVNSMFIGSSNEIGAFESGVTAKLFGTVPSVVLGGVADARGGRGDGVENPGAAEARKNGNDDERVARARAAPKRAAISVAHALCETRGGDSELLVEFLIRCRRAEVIDARRSRRRCRPSGTTTSDARPRSRRGADSSAARSRGIPPLCCANSFVHGMLTTRTPTRSSASSSRALSAISTSDPDAMMTARGGPLAESARRTRRARRRSPARISCGRSAKVSGA